MGNLPSVGPPIRQVTAGNHSKTVRWHSTLRQGHMSINPSDPGEVPVQTGPGPHRPNADPGQSDPGSQELPTEPCPNEVVELDRDAAWQR